MQILLASLHPRPFSGQIHSLRALARGLSAAGDDVQLRTLSEPSYANSHRIGGVARQATAMLGLARLLAREASQADLVHLELPTPSFSLLADWLVARVRVPLVVGYEAPLISRSTLGAVARESRRQPAFFLPRLLVNNRLVAAGARYRAAGYVVSTEYQRAQLTRLGLRAPVAVIPNVVDAVGAAGAGVEQRVARQALGLPVEAPLVGYVGHFHPVKGVEDLVAAFAQLHGREPRARLVIAWSGLGDRAAVERQITTLGCQDSAIWLGRVSLAHLLRSLDVLALPYRLPIGQNAFPNLLLEAQEIGVPLVSTRIPVVDEACQAPGAALLVPPGQTVELAIAIASLLADPAKRERMVQRQARQFAERFAPDLLIPSYRALYRSALGALAPEPVASGWLPETVRTR